MRKIWINNSYKYYDLDEDKQKELYEVFRDTYVQSTGASFDESTFDHKAQSWLFFGVPPSTEGRQCGGIAVRIQRSGMAKLVASFGNARGIMDGLKEMESEIGDLPIWGFMEKNMVGMLKRADHNFVELPPIVVKTMVGRIASTGTIPGYIKTNPDGSVKFDTPSGEMDKYYVCNKEYVKWILEQAENHDVPIVLKGAIKLLKALI